MIAARVDDTGSVGITGPVTSTSGVFIAVDPTMPNANMAALFKGPIVVRDGCVLMGGGSGRPSLPIWPHGFTATEDSGRLVVRDATGNIIVSEGQEISMGGGFVAEFQPVNKVMPKDYQVTQVEQSLGYTIPDRCLTGIYGIWGAGEIVTSPTSPTTASQ